MSEQVCNSLNEVDQLHPIGQHLRLEWNKAQKSKGQKRTRTTANGQRRLVSRSESKKSHALYQHELCYWPFCETPCSSLDVFLEHLITRHLFDDKSCAECTVQQQIVEGLEQQLLIEKKRLRSMIKHLQQVEAENETVTRKVDTSCVPDECSTAKEPTSTVITAGFCNFLVPSSTKTQPVEENSPYLLINVKPEPTEHFDPLCLYPQEEAKGGSTATDAAMDCMDLPTFDLYSTLDQLTSEVTSLDANPILLELPKRTKDNKKKKTLSLMHYRYKFKASIASSTKMVEDLRRNRQFYQTVKKRPPFTFAALIRQAILESPDNRLTLKEIYNWFEHNFAYFREIVVKHSMAAWKNSIRHTLSLNKCFVRVENEAESYSREFGAPWTVNDTLYHVYHPSSRLRSAGPSHALTRPGRVKKSKLSSYELSVEDSSSQLTANNLYAAEMSEDLLRTQNEPELDVRVKEEPEKEESFYGYAEDEVGFSPPAIIDNNSNATPDTNCIQCLDNQDDEEDVASYEDYKLNIHLE